MGEGAKSKDLETSKSEERGKKELQREQSRGVVEVKRVRKKRERAQK